MANREGLPLPAVVVAVLAASAIGCVLGFAARYLTAPEPEPLKLEPQIIQQELSAEELAALCEPEFKDERQTLIDAQAKVKTLQGDLDAKEKELAELKADAEKNTANREAAVKKWKAKELEIADLRIQLSQAQGERDQIKTELEQTIKELNKEIVARKKAELLADHFKNESTENLWSSFGNNAKVELCDRGSRRRHEKCHESVEAVLTPELKERFKVCVDSYQAVPVLKRLDKKQALPPYSEQLPEDNKFTDNGWYILFCDPTLPEASANPTGGEEPTVGMDGETSSSKPNITAPAEEGEAAGDADPSRETPSGR